MAAEERNDASWSSHRSFTLELERLAEIKPRAQPHDFINYFKKLMTLHAAYSIDCHFPSHLTLVSSSISYTTMIHFPSLLSFSSSFFLQFFFFFHFLFSLFSFFGSGTCLSLLDSLWESCFERPLSLVWRRALAFFHLSFSALTDLCKRLRSLALLLYLDLWSL